MSTKFRLIDVFNKFFLLVLAYVDLIVIYKLVSVILSNSFTRTIVVLVLTKQPIVLIHLIF
jgi:hypothetical protein